MATQQFMSDATEVLSATGSNTSTLVLIIAGSLILIGMLVYLFSTLAKRKHAQASAGDAGIASPDSEDTPPTP